MRKLGLGLLGWAALSFFSDGAAAQITRVPSGASLVALGSAPACRNPGPPAGAQYAPAAGLTSIARGGDKYGDQVTLAIDNAGAPMVAYLDMSVGTLFFAHWDRCFGRWNVKTIDSSVMTNLPDGEDARQVAIAVDPVSEAVAIAYARMVTPGTAQNPVNPESHIFLAVSLDNGDTFSAGSELIHHTVNGHWDANPRIAIYDGRLYMVHDQTYGSCTNPPPGTNPYCAAGFVQAPLPGAANAAKQKPFLATAFPYVADGYATRQNSPIALALDAAHEPAVAYLVTPTAPHVDANAVILRYWRPLTPGSAPVTVTDSNQLGNSDPSVSMLFEGNEPRIVTRLRRTGQDGLLFITSPNAGTTWAPPALIPPDGGDSVDFVETFARAQNGRMAALGRANAGTGTAHCGAPKYSSYVNGTWSTCGLDTTKTLRGAAGKWITAGYGLAATSAQNQAGSQKLMAAYKVTPGTSDPINSGVVLWREP